MSILLKGSFAMDSGTMTVRDIIEEYLVENDFDGLAGDFCGCPRRDLFCCGCDCPECQPGYRSIATEENAGEYGVEPGDEFFTTDKLLRVTI